MPRKSATATWPKASISIPRILANQNRRRDQRNANVEAVLAAMRKGARLHLSHSPRPHWRLSSGEFVTSETAREVTAHPNVAGVGDALFQNVPGQTWRFVEEETTNV